MYADNKLQGVYQKMENPMEKKVDILPVVLKPPAPKTKYSQCDTACKSLTLNRI